MQKIILIIALITFTSTLIGGAIAIKLKKYLPYFFSFAAGSLIGVAFFDLIPESVATAQETNIPIRTIMTAVVIAFLIYSIIEKYFLTHPHHEEDGHKLGEIGAGSLIMHSFLDGIAIGTAYQINASIGLIVALAVIFHDFTDGINTVTIMLKNKHNETKAKKFLIVDAIAPVLGVVIASSINIPEKFLTIVLALFAGEFLYIGAATLVPEIHKHHSKRIILFMILGAALIFGLTSFLKI